MTKRRKRGWRRLPQTIQHAAATAATLIIRLCARAGPAVWRRIRPRGPSVIVDTRRRQAVKLRAAVRRAAREYARGVGVELTRQLLVVVQKVVHDERQLNALLQAFDGPAESRRYVIYLALSVNGRTVAEDELLSALRHQLAQVLGDATGKPVLNVPLDLEVPRLRSGAQVVELKREPQPSEDSHERGAIPVERIEQKAS
jgi:hypothetical protein